MERIDLLLGMWLLQELDSDQPLSDYILFLMEERNQTDMLMARSKNVSTSTEPIEAVSQTTKSWEYMTTYEM